MPYIFTEEKHGIVVKFEHDFSDAMYEANKRILQHPRFELLRYQIVDLSSVRQFTISQQVMRKIAQQDVVSFARNPHMLVAVISPDLLMKGINRIYESQVQKIDAAAGWKVQMFDTEPQARAWLLQQGKLK